MNKEEAERAVINAALEWRESDELEPIGSPTPGEKLTNLAFAIDALRGAERFDIKCYDYPKCKHFAAGAGCQSNDP